MTVEYRFPIDLQTGMRVGVYRHLHKNAYSVVLMEGPYKGTVVAHTPEITISSAIPRVSEVGRQRALKLNRRSVHAILVGRFKSFKAQADARAECVTYNPQLRGEFFYKKSNLPFTGATVVSLDQEGMKVHMN